MRPARMALWTPLSFIVAAIAVSTAAEAGSPGAGTSTPIVTTPVDMPTFLGLGRGVEGAFSVIAPPALTVEGLDPSGRVLVDGLLTGLRASVSNAWRIDRGTQTPLLVEWNQGFGVAWGRQSYSTALSGSGDTYLVVGAPPVGSATVVTTTDATGAFASVTASVVDDTGDTGSITSSAFSPSGVGAAATQYAITATSSGGIYTALTTDGDALTASGYAAFYDSGGFAYLGVGDRGDTRLLTSLNDNLVSIEQEFLLGVPLSQGTDWSVIAKAGPTYRYTNRTVNRTETIDFDESVAGASLPALGLDSTDRLTTHAVGFLVGVGVSAPLSDSWSMSFGLTGGLNMFTASHESRSSVVGIGTENVPARESQAVLRGVGANVGGRISLSQALPRGGILSYSLFGEYQYGVPTLSVTDVASPDVTIAPGGGSGTFTGTDTAYRETGLTTGSSWNVGIGLSYTIRF